MAPNAHTFDFRYYNRLEFRKISLDAGHFVKYGFYLLCCMIINISDFTTFFAQIDIILLYNDAFKKFPVSYFSV